MVIDCETKIHDETLYMHAYSIVSIQHQLYFMSGSLPALLLFYLIPIYTCTCTCTLAPILKFHVRIKGIM